MPAGKIRNAEVANLARAHEDIERQKHLVGWRHGIESMQLKQIDIVGAETPQRAIDRRKEMVTRRSHIIGIIPEPEGCLGREKHPVTSALHRLAKNPLRFAEG